MSALETVLQRVLGSTELDAPSLSFLCSLLQEEVDFLIECPGSLSGAQLLHLLTVKLEETLVTYEVVNTEGQGRDFCARLIHGLIEAKLIQIADDNEGDGADGGAASSPASLLSASPPKLSSPVRISDITRAEAEAAAASGFTSMSSIQRAKAPWSASEEAVLFQSLESSKRAHGDGDGLDGEDDEVVEEGGCAMCARDMPLTRHHLIPRMHHKHGAYAKMTSEHLNRCILICRPCHSAIHKLEDEKTLAARFHTLQLLMADERIQKWVAYISKRRVNRTHAQAGTKGLHYGK